MSASATPLTLPGASSLRLWLVGDRGTIAHATMQPSGAAPPAVTLSGNLTSAPPIWIRLDTNGPRGTAFFSASVDGGLTYGGSQVTAASVLIGTTGITANFPNSTYTNDNIYKTLITTWLDQSGQGNDFSQATATACPLLDSVVFAGRRSLLGDGVNTVMVCVSALASQLVGGDDASLVVFAAVRLASLPASRGVVFVAWNNSAAQSYWVLYVVVPPGGWALTKQDAIPVNGQVSGPEALSANVNYVLEGASAGVVCKLISNGNPGNAGAVDVGPLTVDRCALFKSDANSNLNGYIGEVIAYAGDLGSIVSGPITSYLRSRWAA